MNIAPAEPRVKRNKRCLVCNGERKHGYQPRVDPMVYERDPFCSRVCAEHWWKKSEGAAHE